MGKDRPIIVLYGLWYATFIIGLNSAQFLAGTDRLIFIFLLFFLVELVMPKKGFIINIFLALLIIQNINYPGKFYTFYWMNWLVKDISREISSIGNGGDYLPITAMCINLIVIILMQTLFTRTCYGGRLTTLFFCLGTTLLSIVYVGQTEGTIAYVLIFAFLGLLIKASDLTESNAHYNLGKLLRISFIWISAIILFSFALPSHDSFDVGDWFREEIIYRQSLFSSPKNRVGYNAYDGELGGPLTEDDTPVLRVNSSLPVYLKGETKSFYTGRGWESGSKYAVSSLPAVEASYFPPENETDIHVQVLSPSRILYVPRYPKRISLVNGYRILYPTEIDINYYPYEYYIYRAKLRTGSDYRIAAYIPEDDPDLLRQLSNTNADSKYLSLENIPDRVQHLSRTVVLGKMNGYDKAISLMTYLKNGKWEYSIDTDSPPKGTNFVEHFLFELKAGYCVHFSTAFTLMARSVGLPARWVKGYNYGIPEGKNTYLVSNNNAHSWTEIWFDGCGWVPFDPTPANPSLQVPVRNEYRELIEPEGRWDRGIYNHDLIEGEIVESLNYPRWIAYISIAAILILVVMFVKHFWYDGDIGIDLQYARLQSRLKLFGWQRYPWETPKEHVNRVDWLPEKQKLSKFICRLEETIYGDKKPNEKSRGFGKAYSYLGLLLHRLKKINKNPR